MTCNDHTPAVIVSAMEKLGVQGEPTDYELVYVPDGKSKMLSLFFCFSVLSYVKSFL